jgi:hypothetical protein
MANIATKFKIGGVMGKWTPNYPSHSLIIDLMKSTIRITQQMSLKCKLSRQGKTFNMKILSIPSHMSRATGASGLEAMDLFQPEAGGIEDIDEYHSSGRTLGSHTRSFLGWPWSVTILIILYTIDFLHDLVYDYW